MIVPTICTGCVPCVIEEVCDKHAIFRESLDEKPWVDFYKCVGCMRCEAYCTYNAIDAITQPCNGQGKMGW